MKATYEDAIATIKHLTSNGHQSFLAGGCVRDLLLGVAPSDFDITTSATPELVQALFPKTVPVGASFGVVKVVVDGSRELDVATMRKDGLYSDNRRPDTVEYTKSPEEDVRRRDFTINAMLMDADGKILDFVGGQEDLKNRLLRTVGYPADRFNEDALRMMRAVRFAVRFNMTIDYDVIQAIRALSHIIVNISKERVTDELIKTFSHGNCDRAYILLRRLHLWDNWFTCAPYDHNSWESLTGLSKVLPGEPFILPLLIILQSVYSSTYNATLEKLTLTNSQRRELTSLNDRYPVLRNFLDATLPAQRKMMQWDNLDLVRRFIECESELPSINYVPKPPGLLATRQAEIVAMGWPEPIVNGDILQEMGFIACPAFSGMLEKVRDEQLEGYLQTVEEVRHFIISHFPAAPRTLANGTIQNGMARVHMMAACPHCRRAMGFTIERNAQGQPLWDTMDNHANIAAWTHGAFLYCKSCGSRKKKTGFREVQI